MLIHDDMDQLRGLLREEIAAEGAAIRRDIVVTTAGTKADLARLADQIRSLESEAAKTREIVKAIDRKLDQAQEDIAAIMTTVIEHHSALEQRVARIEERLQS
jgi:chromosome segregation ATPase